MDIHPSILEILLADKTTGQCIRWATDLYEHYGDGYGASDEILPHLITGSNTYIIKPRIAKNINEQRIRTQDKAEVFTPSWICNLQNNLIDEQWFNRDNVFNTASSDTWIPNTQRITFPKGKYWTDYIDNKRLEVTCGEAPYLVSRYDTVTGESIPIEARIGLLDRKLRIVCENTDVEEDWMKWTIRSFQSIYGYEYQGDSLLLARENLLFTFIDYYRYKFKSEPSIVHLKKIVNIISWNLWQMDAYNYTAPYSQARIKYKQISLFDYLNGTEDEYEPMLCKIYDWRSKVSLEFKSMVDGVRYE